MSWLDLPWGFWNGVTAWIVLIVHAFGGWSEYPLYDLARNGNWYGFGFLLGAGSPFLGVANAGGRRAVPVETTGRLPDLRQGHGRTPSARIEAIQAPA